MLNDKFSLTFINFHAILNIVHHLVFGCMCRLLRETLLKKGSSNRGGPLCHCVTSLPIPFVGYADISPYYGEPPTLWGVTLKLPS